MFTEFLLNAFVVIVAPSPPCTDTPLFPRKFVSVLTELSKLN